MKELIHSNFNIFTISISNAINENAECTVLSILDEITLYRYHCVVSIYCGYVWLYVTVHVCVSYQYKVIFFTDNNPTPLAMLRRSSQSPQSKGLEGAVMRLSWIWQWTVIIASQIPKALGLTSFKNCLCNLGSLSPPSAAYMRQWIGSALVQIMACRLFGAKPLSKPRLDYIQLDP